MEPYRRTQDLKLSSQDYIRNHDSLKGPCRRTQLSQLESKRQPLVSRPTRKAVLAATAVDSGGYHRDSILSVASIKLNKRLLLASNKDGIDKVWKYVFVFFLNILSR
ncbi:hypothetical protein Tco_1536480 [Tanacetum coccineum]